MASATRKTEKNRKRKRAKMGNARKAKVRSNGTTLSKEDLFKED